MLRQMRAMAADLDGMDDDGDALPPLFLRAMAVCQSIARCEEDPCQLASSVLLNAYRITPKTV